MPQAPVGSRDGRELKIGAQSFELVQILSPRQQRVAVFLVEPRHCACDVADISPDAEIANPAHVDDDMKRRHAWPPGVSFSMPSRPLVSSRKAGSDR